MLLGSGTSTGEMDYHCSDELGEALWNKSTCRTFGKERESENVECEFIDQQKGRAIGEIDGGVACLGKENLGRWRGEKGEIQNLSTVIRSLVIE